MTTFNVNHFTEVELTRATRFSTGYPELDWLYGSNSGETTYGMPRGALSLWGGAAGVGKTRTAMAVCEKLLWEGKRVLYFALEMTSGAFKEKHCKSLAPDAQLYVSEDSALKDQVAAIRHYKPDLIVVDSVNEIDEHTGGQKGTKAIQAAYRDVISPIGSHVVFITHLNANRKIKGGTYLPHMVDTVFVIYKAYTEVTSYMFAMAIPEKNRYGKTGIDSVWVHHEWGVECQSKERFKDEDWWKAQRGKKGMQVRGMFDKREKKATGWFNRLFG